MRTLVLLLLAAAAVASAQPAARNWIRTAGDATVAVPPDQLVVHVEVFTRGATADATAADHAQKMAAILRDLKQAAGITGRVQAIGYSLDQVSGAGYSAHGTVQAAIDDGPAADRVLSAAERAGAKAVPTLWFTLKNYQQAQAQALGEATARARSKAEGLAASLGVRVIEVLSVEETGAQQPQSVAMPIERQEGTPLTVVSPGPIDVHVAVTLTVATGR
jgi:uncharacterized protein YggE